LQVSIGGDRRGIAIGIVRADAAGQSPDFEIAAQVQEERHRIAAEFRAFAAGIAHPVRGRGQHVIGQPLQHVADIDDQCAFGRSDFDPFPFAGQQFEPGFLGAEQEGDEIDVLVCPGANGPSGASAIGG
jgi:hypothetical protein